MPPNERLRHQRKVRGWSLDDVASRLDDLAAEIGEKRLGVTASMVGKWERGDVTPRPPYPKLLCRLFGTTADQLGLYRPRLDLTAGTARDILVSPASPSGIVLPATLTESAPALATPAHIPRRLDPEAIRRLQTILVEYTKVDNLLGPAHLLTLMRLHLNFISELLTVASGQARQELLVVGAKYAEFTGWLHQDAGDPQSAAYWTDRALMWAEATEDPLLISYVLMRRSNVVSGQGDSARTLRLARAALSGQDRLSPRARALALRQEAHGYALSGDADGCARALDDALDHASSSEDHGDQERTLTHYCTPSYVEGEAADCWILLGQPLKAVRILEHGLADWPPEYQRDRGLNLARLAVAHAAGGQPEQACAVAEEAALVVHTAESARAVAELRRLCALLAPWSDLAAVGKLGESLATLL